MTGHNLIRHIPSSLACFLLVMFSFSQAMAQVEDTPSVPSTQPAPSTSTPEVVPTPPPTIVIPPPKPEPARPAPTLMPPPVVIEEEVPSGEEEMIIIDVSNYIAPTVEVATKEKRKLESSPSIVTVFTKDDIERLHARTLADLLPFVPGFYEVSGQLDRNFSIRGIHAASAQHFVVMIDGMVTNDFLTSTAAPDAYSLDYADRVEIIRGPGSAIYGANALMGVVNIVSKGGGTYKKFRNVISGGKSGYIRNSFSDGVDFGDKGKLFFSGTIWHDGGFSYDADGSEDVLIKNIGSPNFDGIQEGENLTKPRGGGKVRVNKYGVNYDLFSKYELSDLITVRMNMARNDFRPQRSYGQALLGTDETQPPEYINQRVVLDVEERIGTPEKYGRLSFRQAIMHFTHEMNSQRISKDFYPAAATENQFIIYNWSGSEARFNPSVEYDKKLPDFAVFNDNRFVVGVQLEYDVAYNYSMTRCWRGEASAFQSYQPGYYGPDVLCNNLIMLNEGMEIDDRGEIKGDSNTSHLGDGDEIRLGGYLQYSNYFTDYFGLVLGARVDYHPDFGPQFSPRVALLSDLGAFYAKGQFSMAFAYPAFLYRTGNAASHYIGNPDIDPQSIRAYEFLVGVRGKIFRTELSVYYNQVRKFITYDFERIADTGRYEFSNQGDIDVVGFEGTARLALLGGRLTFDVNGSFAKPVGSTDDIFKPDGWLAGPTKFPKGIVSFITNVIPWDPLTIGLSMLYTGTVVGPFQQQISYGWTGSDGSTFEGVTGTDGTPYASKKPEDYNTDAIILNAAASFRFLKHWKLAMDLSNIIGKKYYRPGSVLVPYILPGFNAIGSLAFEY